MTLFAKTRSTFKVNDSSRVPFADAGRAAVSLGWREIIRFLRQRNRVVGAVGQPVLFWLLFGTGMNQSFETARGGFREYFVPGTLMLILLFTAIFATISIIEDRTAGFLQSVLVAPVPRWSFVVGKVLGGSMLAVGQAALFLVLAMLTNGWPSVSHVMAIVALMCVSAVGLTCLGFCLAWRLDSTHGFHAIMNLLLMPMWLLSGAFFPIPRLEVAGLGEKILHAVMRANPVTYSVAGLRQLLVGGSPSETSGLWLPSLSTCWIVSLLFSVAMLCVATVTARRTTLGDLR